MSMDKEPLVSVVIPMWNRENTIARALKSVEQQTYSNCEIVVVDDFSTDNSIEVAKGIDLPSHLIKAVQQQEMLASKQQMANI